MEVSSQMIKYPLFFFLSIAYAVSLEVWLDLSMCRSVNVLMTNPIWVIVTRMQVDISKLDILCIFKHKSIILVSFSFAFSYEYMSFLVLNSYSLFISPSKLFFVYY